MLLSNFRRFWELTESSATNRRSMSWYDNLRNIESRGSQADRPGSLANLSEARKVHMGQFFTPDAVAALMWRIVQPAMIRMYGKRTVSILDNSIGTGRLLQYASPELHKLYGVDVDSGPLLSLGKAAQAAGFSCEFEACGMEAIRPRNIDVALINPPFSLHLESPLLKGYPCNCYGKFGPNTSSMSHAYALAQAVDGCQLVVALLPSTFAEEVVSEPDRFLPVLDAERIRAHVTLPPSLFRQEGTDVRVSLLVCSAVSQGFMRIKLESLGDVLPDLGLNLTTPGEPKMKILGVTDDKPAITRPVTGDTTVRVAHNSRRIVLGFNCGLTEAKILNAILVRRLSDVPVDFRRPEEFKYTGQGKLDVEVHLAQPDPVGSFSAFLEEIRKAGGTPIVHSGVWGYLKRRIRQSLRQQTPLGHTVYVPDGVAGTASDRVVAAARRGLVADKKIWGSPYIPAGESIAFQKEQDGNWQFQFKGQPYRITSKQLYEDFGVKVGAAEAGWTVVHPGLLEKFSDIARAHEARARQLGIHTWLNWTFQWKDLIETSMKRGAVISWAMGLGKARLGAAIILLSGCRRGLLTVEAGLIDEMTRELQGLPISKDCWQVITTPEQIEDLSQINVISYERLRRPVKGGNSRDTYARRLRRRISVLVCDEADLLANPESDQSRALFQVSAKRRFSLSGTPTNNYPRDILPILAFTVGDCTAAQPWGWRRGYMEQNWRNSVAYSNRGIDAFRNTFVTLEWVTREFENDMLSGAKREVPKIKDVEKYRAMLAPHVKRRVVIEPAVAENISIPPESREVVEILWDEEHLAFYLRVAEDFASWYLRQREDRNRNNLIALLARIRAVSFASDFPQASAQGFCTYRHLTSKQRWVIDEVERLDGAGRKTIVYAENPGQLDLLAMELSKRGVDSVVFHGQKPIKVRTAELNQRFRFGDCRTLLASLGVTAKGHNISQANEVILMSRAWTSTVEEQAIARTLRPQQKENVRVRYAHLAGGIDVYKGQMCLWKKDATEAGFDWATPQTTDMEFCHLDTILERFVKNLAALKGLSSQELRNKFRKDCIHA
ncbi:MAG: helicase [Thermodesulfovibrio sp.]|nr:helicase [Thermodesulfovibrio sp.]